MHFGRLIRITKFGGAPNSIAYIVAIPEAAKAVALIRTEAADPEDKVEDLGRVSDDLLKALKLLPGEYVRADGKRDSDRPT
jgi:hypothetical protein